MLNTRSKISAPHRAPSDAHGINHQGRTFRQNNLPEGSDLRQDVPPDDPELDYLLILGERHLGKVLSEYLLHYNGHRPHQALHQMPPLHEPGREIDITARIERKRVVDGLISEYCRAA